MAKSTPDFSLKISGVEGLCPAGEVHAKQNIAEKRIPVLSCEGPCIRGEIARLAANIVADEAPYARACYAETFLVPHSAMTAWVKGAEKVVVIDGCFLKCIGRITENVIDKEKLSTSILIQYIRNFRMFFYIPMSRSKHVKKWPVRLPTRFWKS